LKRPIGTERFNSGRLERKVQETGNHKEDWKFVHHLIWLEAGREIPPEHILYFKDGNPRNLTLDNLEITTKSEFLKRIAIIRESNPFKMGKPPGRNVKPIGTEIIDKQGYLKRKVSDTGISNKDWQFVHRYIWQEAGREIPPGHVVAFKDGNRKNVTLENLVLMTKVEFARQSAFLYSAKYEHFGFKRNLHSPNKLPIGSERRRKTGFLMRKVQDTGDSSKDWRFVHHLVWIEAGRELPPGHLPFF